jgi:CHAT domain-containing protein/tetratricopeptide (TPR) repeat protein
MSIMRSLGRTWRAWIILALVVAGAGALVFPVQAPGPPQAQERADPKAGWQALAEQGAYSEAVDQLKTLLARPQATTREKTLLYHALGYVLLYARRPGEAAQSLEAARDWALTRSLSSEAASYEAEMAIQSTLAKAVELKNAGDLAGSNARFEEAERLARAAGSLPYELKIVSDWSLNYLRSEDGRGRMEALAFRALALADSLAFRHEAAAVAGKLGTHYILTRDYSRALSCFLTALDKTSGEREASARILPLNNIAVIYSALGDPVRAQAYLREAVSLIPQDARGDTEFSLLINLGHSFDGLAARLHSDIYSERALECYDAYLEFARTRPGARHRPEAMAGKARVLICLGRLDEARALLPAALEEARRTEGALPTAGAILCLLGDLSLRAGSVPEAERSCEEVRALAERTGDSLLKESAAYGLGRVAEARGELDRAAALYDQALRVAGEGFSGIVSDIQRAAFIGRNREAFQALVRLYLRLAKTRDRGVYAREIFRLSEYYRGRSYLEFQARQEAAGPGPAPPNGEEAALARERLDILRSLSQGGPVPEARRRMEDRVIEIDDMLDAAVFDRRRDPNGAARSPKPVPLEVLQSCIPDDHTAVLEYLMGETGSVLFCVRRGALDLIELPPARELEGAVTGFLSFLEDPSLAAEKGLPAARRLYRILLEPAERSLGGGVDRLVIVPDGVLFRLPFEALSLPAAGGAGPVYLGDRFVVSYAPAASALVSAAGEAKGSPAYPKDALVFGVWSYPKPAAVGSGALLRSPGAVLDDLYGRRGFEALSLPYVRDELEDLRKRLPPDRVDSFVGAAATEHALKSLDLGLYRLIHLACHAFSDESYPLRSAFRLAPGKREDEDGYLQVSEMYDLKTKADLVVLSSCQTGRGAVVTNEGNLGLPRVFFYMGARSVLSTLWPVDDRAAALFMKGFYDAYFRGLGKAESLRAAKRAMARTKYAHPYYWASYVLTGGF